MSGNFITYMLVAVLVLSGLVVVITSADEGSSGIITGIAIAVTGPLTAWLLKRNKRTK
ncbi:MAG TPA: hypothetical protein VFZ78_04150 [Flavisolibacter sp.]